MTPYVLSGGTSELGNRVVSQLAQRLGPKQITCLVRPTSHVGMLGEFGVHIHVGDVTQPETFVHLLGPDTIYIDMTHPKHYHKSLAAVRLSGVKRGFFVTTTGIYSKYNAASDIYKVNESRIKESGIQYTILRPSLIYGTDRDRNMTKLLKVLSQLPLFPIFGTGDGLMQPVYVQDLADAIVTTILHPELSRNKEYNLCGPTALPYQAILKLAAEALGRRVHFLHIPHGLAIAVASIGERVPGFPISKEQVLRLLENKNFDISLAKFELGYAPREFSTGIRQEVALLRAKGLL